MDDAMERKEAVTKRKPKQPVKFKKAPQAPRRFKSAYMFFSTAKHPEIRARLKEEGNVSEKTTNIAKMVSKEWKELSEEEREKWEEMARKDKARFEMEKTMYTGPWKVPAKKRSHKDPSAPKRPMSAFLSFSNSKRAETKRNHPHCSNAEISRILAKMWKDASEEERKEHIDREFELRQKYKVAIAEWKKNEEVEMQARRQEREDVASKAAATRTETGLVPPMMPATGDYGAGGSAGYYFPAPGQAVGSYPQPDADRVGSTYQPDASTAQYGNPTMGGYYPQYGYTGTAAYDTAAQPSYGNPSFSTAGGGYQQYPPQYNYGQGYEAAGQPQEGADMYQSNAAYMQQQQGAPSYSGYGGDYSSPGAGEQHGGDPSPGGGQRFNPYGGHYQGDN